MNQQPPQAPSNQPQTPYGPQTSPTPPQGPMYYGAPPQPSQNPGKVFGIVSIVVSFLLLAIIGLPFAIVSIVQSSRARAPKILGIIGLVLNIISLIISAFLLLQLFNNAGKEIGGMIERGEGATIGKVRITLDKQYKPAKGVAVWRHNQLPSGWSETSNLDGVHTYKDKQGGILTSQSMQLSDAGSGSDGVQSEQYARQIEKELTKDATHIGEQTKIKAIIYVNDPNKWLEFTVLKRTYTNKQGEEMDAVIAVRAYGGDKALVLVYTGYDKYSTSGPGETIIRQFYVKEGGDVQS